MLLKIDKFGGYDIRPIDPRQLPENRSQAALYCRFDRGGIMPILKATPYELLTKAGDKMSLFIYYNAGSKYVFSWTTDVDAVKAPLPNDAYNRVYYTEGGVFKVTDSTLFDSGGTDYPMANFIPSPPAPVYAPDVALPAVITTSAISGTPILSGGHMLDGTYYYVVTAIDTYGNETLQSAESSGVVISGGGDYGCVNLTWLGKAGVITYKIYRTTVSGTYGTDSLVRTQANSGGSQSYVDDLLAPTAGSPPTQDPFPPSSPDPTLLQTVGYVYTWVNSYGDEGPPSPVSTLIDRYDGNSVIVGIVTTSVAAEYAVTKKRIYRTNQTVSGTSQFQFVAEIALATTSYNDVVLSSALGEVLATTEWDGPPAGVTGLIALPNGVLACFVGNTVCFSVPFYPHAWPTSYQKSTDQDIIGLGSFGNTVVVITKGKPYLIIGDDPANYVMDQMDGLPGTSKRGIVQMIISGAQTVIYPCTMGLFAVGSNVKGLITTEVIPTEVWKNKYTPTSFYSYSLQSKYYGFYTPVGRSDLGAVALLIYDVTTKDLVDCNYYALAGVNDEVDDTLYLNGGTVGDTALEVYKVNDGYSGTAYDLDYKSKRYKYLPNTFGCIKVIATDYPLYVDVIYPEIPETFVIEVTDEEPIRLPPRMTTECEIRIYDVPESVAGVYMANRLEELPL